MIHCRGLNAGADSSNGASLMMALVVLVIMSVAAISLVRSVNTGKMIASNLAFRQAAALASDAGTEAAIRWLEPQVSTAALYADQGDQGYYASVPQGLDISGLSTQGARVAIDWEGDQCAGSTASTCVSAAPALAADPAGNVIRYTVHRLCRYAGSPYSGSNSCLMADGGSGASAKRGQLSYGASSRFGKTTGTYYRITVRVRGPRNTTVFTQVLVHY